MSNLSLSGAELIALIIGAVLYGIYLVTLGIAGRSLLMTETGQWKRRSAINWVIVVVSAVLPLCCTPALAGQNTSSRTGLAGKTITKSFNVPFQSLIYRCWFLWNKSLLVIALPMLIWLANIACAIRLVDLIAQASKGSSSERYPALGPGQPSVHDYMYQCYGLIVGRIIWLVERQNRRFRVPGVDTVATSREGQSPPKSTLSRAMRNIIESGMIYTVVSIFPLATYTLKSNLHYPASGMEIHSVGITFNLILIRAARIGSASARQRTSRRLRRLRPAPDPNHPNPNPSNSPSSEGVFRFSRFHKEEEGEGEFGRRAEAV
ncbi:hypothetical protein B0H14DRAFT_3758333 [Mycena olivaceomarginata]|nr:hypothetical protein B0H14DRAFT_3758333 [Mycena olivaceomarginata]